MILILNDEGLIEVHNGSQIFYPASEIHGKNIVNYSLKQFRNRDPDTILTALTRGIYCDCAYLYNGQAYFME